MKRVLIVEDEQHIARGLQFNLEAEGFAARITETGEEALEAVRAGGSFDALLVDVMLPGMDGFEVVRKLRSNGCYVPVMMLTARRRPEDIVEGLSAGAGRLPAEAVRSGGASGANPRPSAKASLERGRAAA